MRSIKVLASQDTHSSERLLAASKTKYVWMLFQAKGQCF